MKILNLFLPILSLLLISCEPPAEDCTVTIKPTILEMKVGESQQLNYVVTPSGTSLEWSSDNEDVVTVFHGTVTAVAIGSANVTVSAGDAKSSCKIFVTNVSGKTLTIHPAVVSLDEGETFQFEFANVYDAPLTWSSANEDKVSISQTGEIKALDGGISTITLSNGSEEVTALVSVNRTWGDYSLVWSDEFDGTSLDLDTWNIEVNGTGGGNRELQYYTDRQENLRVEDGNLVIEAHKENYLGRNYTSGRINSLDNKEFRFGKIEARISLPQGVGTWPAFWMMGGDFNEPGVGWPKCGEIDIMEHVGYRPDYITCALHYGARNGMNGSHWHSGRDAEDVEGNYNVYGIEWVEESYMGRDEIHFTFNGEVFATATEDLATIDQNYYWPFNKDHFIIFNLAIGGTMGGEVDDNMFNEDVMMKVDWVRVYQREEL